MQHFPLSHYHVCNWSTLAMFQMAPIRSTWAWRKVVGSMACLSGTVMEWMFMYLLTLLSTVSLEVNFYNHSTALTYYVWLDSFAPIFCTIFRDYKILFLLLCRCFGFLLLFGAQC